MSYLETIEKFEKELAARTYSWQDFYPGLNGDDWQVTEDDRGIRGKKVGGKLAGTVAFFIPAERLIEGPSTHPEPSNWEFKRVKIGKDMWLIGVANNGDEKAWFGKGEGEEKVSR